MVFRGLGLELVTQVMHITLQLHMGEFHNTSLVCLMELHMFYSCLQNQNLAPGLLPQGWGPSLNEDLNI